MKFTIAFVASILISSVYGLAPAFNARENVDIDARAGPPQACGDCRHAIPLLRAYSPSKIDHLYTTDVAEFQNAITRRGYKDEGTTGYVFSHQEPDAIPLYRLDNAAAGDHLYTTDAEERDDAAAHRGYTKEGITGYVYPDAVCGALPLYRLYSSAGTDHLYTMSVDERDSASEHLGYAQQGTAAYIFPS